MGERITLRLFSATQGHEALQQIWRQAKALLTRKDSPPLVVELREENRSLKQNALLHAMLGDISRQVEWAGSKREPEVWKRLLTAAWLRARGESVELLPALDGHGVDIVFRHTSKLTRAECAELCDFIAAWAIENGCEFRESLQWQVCPETGEIN